MVMTYVFTSNLAESAKYLDNGRISKQAVEAFQILLALQDLRIMGQIFYQNVGPMPIYEPNNKQHRETWVKTVLQLYRSWDHYVVRTDTIYFVVPKNEMVTHINGLRPLYRQSYIGNSIVRMWMGHEIALMDYINIHIREHLSRNGKTNMHQFDLSNFPGYQFPAWVFDPKVHAEHVAKIMDQERYRDYMNDCLLGGIPFEAPKGKKKPTKVTKQWRFEWYSQFDLFNNAQAYTGYNWL